ncbi:THO complex subunit 3 [Ischnura elegans]|uniref:THO complex subunit 3 n=1 Tax=Ischnura elegans TaxID=197161 RepID=UPI001ED89B1B|nr:THO complex subunit 3 [Ischnura elegans]
MLAPHSGGSSRSADRFDRHRMPVNGGIEELQNHFKTHKKTREYQAHTSKVHSVGWSCDGRRLASGSFDKSVSIFLLDRDRLNKEFTFRGHGGSVDQLCWHASNPELLSTASGDKTVRIWDVRSQKSAATINTKGENINITWSPDGNTIAVGNKEDLVTFIDTRTHKIKAEEQFKFEVNEISWNKQSNLFFLTNGQGCIHILSYPDLQLQHILQAHPGTCICIEFDPTGRYFATGSADALVSLWDVSELVCLRTFSRLDWPVRTISFSHDGKLLASASEDLVIDIGAVETGEKVADVPVEAATFTVAWHPRLYLLAYACDDKDKYDRKSDAGSLKVFGFQSD